MGRSGTVARGAGRTILPRRDTHGVMKTDADSVERPARHPRRVEPTRRLIAAGFDEQLAGQLADGAAGVDLHELLVLLDRGCPPALAARILAPTDGTA